MTTILEKIIRNKKREVGEKKKRERSFLESIKNPRVGDLGLIAEIKLASPTAGVLGKEEDAVTRGVMYERGGADAISFVTDRKYFGGNLDLIPKIKKAVSLPILMKDFVIDPYQIYEAKMIGADAILFIAKIITRRQLKEFVARALDLGIEPVVEIQNADELRNVLALREGQRAECIAVNARNLTDFKVNIDNACSLIRLIPKDRIALGFSGVKGSEEAEKYKQAGAKAVLVGMALMRTKNIRSFIYELKGLKGSDPSGSDPIQL